MAKVRTISVLAAAIVISACAGGDVMQLDSVAHSARAPESVELLLDAPRAAYTAIALIGSASFSPSLRAKELSKLRALALKTGVDDPIIAPVAELFGLDTSPETLPAKQLTGPKADAKYFVSFVNQARHRRYLLRHQEAGNHLPVFD